MRPETFADDLNEALLDLLPEGWSVLAIHPPVDLSPTRAFLVELVHTDGRDVRRHLPAGMVVAYFADEEGAVDHVERWLESLDGDTDAFG